VPCLREPRRERPRKSQTASPGPQRKSRAVIPSPQTIGRVWQIFWANSCRKDARGFVAVGYCDHANAVRH
jgi:hypothetical protein